jgi:hypothetical protein
MADAPGQLRGSRCSRGRRSSAVLSGVRARDQEQQVESHREHCPAAVEWGASPRHRIVVSLCCFPKEVHQGQPVAILLRAELDQASERVLQLCARCYALLMQILCLTRYR